MLVSDTLQIEQVGAKSSQPHLESSVLPVSWSLPAVCEDKLL